MKKIRYIIIFLLFGLLTLNAQNSFLDNIQGLKSEDNIIYEIAGYTITSVKNKASFNEKGFKKMYKKYGIKNIISEYVDENLNLRNKVVEATLTDKNFPGILYQLCYFLPETEKEMTVLLFQSVQRDPDLEESFLDAYFNHNKLNQYTSNNWIAEKIDFLGRQIDLGKQCRWMSPHNVQCSGLGQMNWSVFKKREEAEADNNTYIKREKNSMYKIIREDIVNILFEGVPTSAKRVVYKIRMPKILLGGSNILIGYYVVEKIRDKYVSCVLSHYGKNENDMDLSPLLREVMSLKSEITPEN